MKLYRPSNGTEGDAFENMYCDKCLHFSDKYGCPIQLLVFATDIEDENYHNQSISFWRKP